MRIGTDIDGTLTRWGLRVGGRGRAGVLLWRALRRTGAARWLLRHAPPREWVCEVLRDLCCAGASLYVVTARLRDETPETLALLRQERLVCAGLASRAPDDDRPTCAQKAEAIHAFAVDLYLNDNADENAGIRDYFAARWWRCPRLLDVTCQQAEVLKLREEARGGAIRQGT